MLVYRVWSLVLWFDLCVVPYFLCPFPGPYRAGVPGRLFPVSSVCASQRGAVCRGSAYSRSKKRVEVGSGVWPGLPVVEAVWRRTGVRRERCSFLARPSDWRGGPESEAGAVSPRPGLLVGDWIVLLACCLGIWSSPGVVRRSKHCLLG